MADGWATYGSIPYNPSTPALAPPRPIVATVEAVATGDVRTAVLAAAPGGVVRRISRVTVSTPGTLSRVPAYLYVGDAVPEALVMGTNSGSLDIAEENPPLFVPENTPVTVTWTSGTGRALARFEYTEE